MPSLRDVDNAIIAVNLIASLRLNPAAMDRLADRVAHDGAEQAAQYAREELRGHSASGALLDGIRIVKIGRGIYDVVADTSYARFVNDGTGIYGPHGRPIVSPTGGVMRFTPKSGGLRFARSVSGQPPVRFMVGAGERLGRQPGWRWTPNT